MATDFWSRVGHKLLDEGQNDAAAWWQDHGPALLDMGRESAERIAAGMQRSKQTAVIEALEALEPAEFQAVMQDTVDELAGIAQRRASLIAALKDAAEGLLGVVGRAVLAMLRGGA